MEVNVAELRLQIKVIYTLLALMLFTVGRVGLSATPVIIIHPLLDAMFSANNVLVDVVGERRDKIARILQFRVANQIFDCFDIEAK